MRTFQSTQINVINIAGLSQQQLQHLAGVGNGMGMGLGGSMGSSMNVPPPGMGGMGMHPQSMQSQGMPPQGMSQMQKPPSLMDLDQDVLAQVRIDEMRVIE